MIGVYDWHRGMGHRSKKTMVDMANGAVTGMVLKTYCKTCRGWTVLRSRAKPEGPAKLEVWAAKVEVKPVMFDDEKELVAERMRGYCEHKGIRVNSSVQYSPLANGVAERQQHARCYAIQTSRRASGQRG